MQKAYKGNERGRKIKGGSTISQQTAKNVFLWQGQLLWKGLEAYFTVLIEFIWGKSASWKCIEILKWGMACIWRSGSSRTLV
jgi:hypothetical protein